MIEKKVAYFCMEFGLDKSFKIYSGGLGILAGDVLKAAKDSGKPMVGVGILWRQGYNRQDISDNGTQIDCFYENTYSFLKDTGVSVTVDVRGREIKLKVWRCEAFGNVPLYLLDANLPENADRLITGQLYGWFDEERVAQEMILGIGGVRALKALKIDVDIYHFNDNHPVFAGLEMIHQRVQEGDAFEHAFSDVKKHIVFTTHTPVEAGNETHEYQLLEYMGATSGFRRSEIISVGGEPFSMTVAGLRMSYLANAVSELHGETARKMWEIIKDGANIISITNGVHNKTWQDEKIFAGITSGDELREVHQEAKNKLFDVIEKRNNIKLNPDVLTIGSARRAASYKRGALIFSNLEIIEPLLKKKKLQIIFSGKAHPNDLDGKGIVKKLFGYSKKYPDTVVFIKDYDMEIGALMTRGCDIWLNTPIRPMEASGTSGMKAAMNGVLNFSILDGWWPEGCIHGVNGWKIGDANEGEDADLLDAGSLYDTLTEDIIPTYYDDHDRWTKMMAASIEMSSKQFSAERMVDEYYEKMYNEQKD